VVFFKSLTLYARKNEPTGLEIIEAMSLNQRIIEDLKAAMKAKDTGLLSCLRMLKTAVKNLQVEKGQERDEEEIRAVIPPGVGKAKGAAEDLRKGNREDLALKEEREITYLYEYLPQQMTSEEIEKTLREIIDELSAKSPKDLGKVMKAAMAKMAGQAQGKEVSKIAGKLLI